MRWHHGWNVLVVAIAFQAVVVGIVFSCFSLWVTPWVQEFHVDRALLMTANSGATLSTGVLMLFAGSAMDRYPMRWLIVGGIVALSAGLVLIAMADEVWQIIALYSTLIAIGFALSATLASQVLAAKWFPHRVGFAVGLVLLGSNVGGIVMPPIVGWLLARYGWRNADYGSAALLLAVVAPLVWLVVRLPAEGEVPTVSHASTPGEPAPDDRPATPPALWTFGAIVREPTFWIIGLAFLGVSLASYAFSQNIGPYAHDLGIGTLASSLLISVFYFASIAGRLTMGAVADHVDPRYPYWVSTALIWGTLLLTLGHPSYPMLVVVSGLIGMGGGGLLPVSSAMVGQKFGPGSFGKVMGMVVPFFSIGAAFGPVIAAQVRDRSASYALAFAPFLAVLPVAAIIMFFLRRGVIDPPRSQDARTRRS
jgi:MFS family permease